MLFLRKLGQILTNQAITNRMVKINFCALRNPPRRISHHLVGYLRKLQKSEK